MKKSLIAEIIRTRRTIHQFQADRLPPREEILQAIEHSTWAPNHFTTEPWKYYLIGDKTSDQICRLNAELVSEKRGEKAAQIKLKRWREIPGWLLLTTTRSDDEIRNKENYAACCCAAQNFMLYCWSKEIGVKWTTGEVTRSEVFYTLLGIDPLLESVVGLFWYGYPKEVPKMARKPIDQIVVEVA